MPNRASPAAAASRGATRGTLPLHAPAASGSRAGLDFRRRPLLVFWECTRACLLSCRHCRASAVHRPLSGELTPREAGRLLEGIAAFGKPTPILVVTGGDALMRRDLFALAGRARQLGLPLALAPSVTPLLTTETAATLRGLGVKVVSISLDGATPAVHDGIRGVEGHFEATLAALRRLRADGFTVQVNTCVMRENVEELPAIAAIVKETGAAIWEVFFLVRVGRGADLAELTPAENEDVCHFLVDASRHGFVVRTVEGPFFRRVNAWRADDPPHADPQDRYALGPLYGRLAARLTELLGRPHSRSRAQTKGTRDGNGIVFVSHDGDVHAAGFLPLPLGNVKQRSLVEIYRDSPLLVDIRAGRFRGRCGVCEYADLCGGSRARAFAATGDPLGEDPACSYVPELAG